MDLEAQNKDLRAFLAEAGMNSEKCNVAERAQPAARKWSPALVECCSAPTSLTVISTA
jgi:hypothetical protein